MPLIAWAALATVALLVAFAVWVAKVTYAATPPANRPSHRCWWVPAPRRARQRR